MKLTKTARRKKNIWTLYVEAIFCSSSIVNLVVLGGCVVVSCSRFGEKAYNGGRKSGCNGCDWSVPNSGGSGGVGGNTNNNITVVKQYKVETSLRSFAESCTTKPQKPFKLWRYLTAEKSMKGRVRAKLSPLVSMKS